MLTDEKRMIIERDLAIIMKMTDFHVYLNSKAIEEPKTQADRNWNFNIEEIIRTQTSVGKAICELLGEDNDVTSGDIIEFLEDRIKDRTSLIEKLFREGFI